MTAHTEDSQSLSLEFLHTCFYTNKDKVVFDPWLLINKFPLLRKIIKRLSEEIESQVDTSELTGICTLARSGIPLGVLLSLSLNKPLHFYFRDPLRFEDKDGHFYHLFPRIKKGGNYLLVDSHVVTLYTASSVAQYIKSKEANIVGLAVAFSFYDMNFSGKTKNIISPIITLGSAAEHSKSISKVLGNNDTDTLYNILKQKSKQQEYYPDSPFIPAMFRRIWALSWGLASIVKNSRESFRIRRLDDAFSNKLQNTFGSQESEIWSLFSYPYVMQEIGQLTNSSLAIENMDSIFAVGFIGTIVALIIAYSSDFQGSIFTTYKPIFWDELIREQNINRVIITTGRLRTGMFIRGTYDLLKNKYNISPSSIIALRYVPSGVLPPRNLFSHYYIRGLKDILYVLS